MEMYIIEKSNKIHGHKEAENSEVQDITNTPHNYHNDPPNDPRIKIKNTNDATE